MTLLSTSSSLVKQSHHRWKLFLASQDILTASRFAAAMDGIAENGLELKVRSPEAVAPLDKAQRREKEQEIQHACEEGSVDRLVELADSVGGLLDDALRQAACKSPVLRLQISTSTDLRDRAHFASLSQRWCRSQRLGKFLAIQTSSS